MSSSSLDSIEWFYLISGILVECIAVIGIIWFFLRRDCFPIRERRPSTVVALIASYIVVCALVTMREVSGDSFNCLLFWSLYSLFNTLLFATLVLRGVLLIVSFNLTQGALQYYRNLNDGRNDATSIGNYVNHGNTSKSWYLTHRNLFTKSYLAIALILSTLILSSPILLYFAFHPAAASANADSSECLDLFYVFRYVDLPFGVIMLLAALEGHKRLKEVREYSLIKEELVQLAVVLVSVAVLISVLVTLDYAGERMNSQPLKDVANYSYTFVRYYVLLLWVLWVSVIQIVQVSYRYEQLEREKLAKLSEGEANVVPQRPSIELMRQEMIQMLEDQVGYDLFHQVLEQQFAIENLLFWRDVFEYKRMNEGNDSVSDESKDIKSKAVEIYRQYVSPDALLLVNLSHAQFEHLRNVFAAAVPEENTSPGLNRAFSGKAIANVGIRNAPIKRGKSEAGGLIQGNTQTLKITESSFDEALAEITNLMCTDSFRRFRLTAKYKEYKIQKHRNLANASVQASRQGLTSRIIEDE